MVRAGWSGMKFSASKLSHSASSSGPSATSQPMATNTSIIWSIRAVIGWIAPVGASSTGRVTSTRSSTSTLGQLDLGDLALPRGQGLRDPAAGLADPLAGVLARLGRQGPDLPVGQGDRRPVAGVGQPGRLELGQRGRRRERGQRLGDGRLDVVGVQRGDLDGVVARVRAGHDSCFGTGKSSAAPPGGLAPGTV